MIAGLEIRNDSNTIQIDQNYKNLALISKTTVTTTALFPGSSTSYVDVVVTSSSVPIVAWGGSLRAGVTSVWVSGTTYHFTLAVDGPVGSTVPIYIFDTPPAPAAHGVGLNVFNVAGDPTYDSNNRYMVVVDYVAVSSTASQTHTGYDTSLTYALMTSILPIFILVTGQPPQAPVNYVRAFSAGLAGIVTGGFQSQQVHVGTDGPFAPPGPPGGGGTSDGAFTLIDVTGY